jgi:hypothetical protein
MKKLILFLCFYSSFVFSEITITLKIKEDKGLHYIAHLKSESESESENKDEYEFYKSTDEADDSLVYVITPEQKRYSFQANPYNKFNELKIDQVVEIIIENTPEENNIISIILL